MLDMPQSPALSRLRLSTLGAGAYSCANPVARSFLTPVLVLVLLAFGVASSEAGTDVFRLATDLDVNSEIDGDAVVLAGDLTLGPEAKIHGDAVAVLGKVHLDDRATVDGRIIALPSLAALDPDPARSGGSLTLKPGLFLITAGLWLVVTTLVASIRPIQIRSAVADLRQAGWRPALLGVVVIVTLFAALVAVLGLGPVWGVPMAGLLMLIFLMFKALGLAILGAWVGGFVTARWIDKGWPIGLSVFVGVSILLLIRLLPGLGGLLWGLVSIAALGVAVFSVLTEWSISTRPVSVPLV